MLSKLQNLLSGSANKTSTPNGMKLIIGLGNPGDKYTNTPHNIGFAAIETIAEEYNCSAWKIDKKANAEISDGIIDDKKVLLAKPQTFMNSSGKTVKALLRFYKISPSDLITIHDDIDIALGAIKISEASGAAGHNGIKSVIREIGTQEFTRIRIGIRPTSGKPANVEHFVLQRFSKTDQAEALAAIQRTSNTLSTLLRQGLEAAMNASHGKRKAEELE